MSDQSKVEPGDVVEAMVAIRDQIAANRKAYEAEDKRLKAKYEKGEVWLKEHMQTQDLTNMGIRGYTVFTTTTLQASVGDWEAIKDFILSTGEVDLLQHRITSGTVKQYMEDNNGQVPPGVSTRSKINVNIRKQQKK